MKERPIIFSAPMVRAILDGRKTQTRRLLRPQPPQQQPAHDRFNFIPAPKQWQKPALFIVGGSVQAAREHNEDLANNGIVCPYGAPGDRLWVRETHAQFAVGEGMDNPVPQCVAYRATCDANGCFDYVNGRGEIMNLKVTKWTPAIHMPRWASRITLEVTGVRVERLQALTEKDAEAEGVGTFENDFPAFRDQCLTSGERAAGHRGSYAVLWDEINGSRAWASNPWVWVIEFQRVTA